MWSIMYHVVLKEGQVLLWVHHLALARPQVPYSGPGQGFGTKFSSAQVGKPKKMSF